MVVLKIKADITVFVLGFVNKTMKIDLWTKDMPVDEMNVFIHQTLVSLSQSFYKATNNDKMTDALISFVNIFLKT